VRNTVNYDGVDFWLTSSDQAGGDFRDGYPYAINNDDTNFPGSLTDDICIALMSNLLQNPPRVGTTAQAEADSNIKYSAQADDAASTCTYIQQEGNSENQFVYEIETGRVTVTLQ
jgi:MSHA pilin protein MshB